MDRPHLSRPFKWTQAIPFPILLAFLLLTPLVPLLQPQTTAAPDQIRDDPENACPAPALTRTDPYSITVGKYWTPDNPCYLYFNVQPVNQPDPLSLVSWTAPSYFKIKSGTTKTDAVYIWAEAPSTSHPQGRIVYGLKDTSLSDCPTCWVQAQTAIPRLMPPQAVPIGFILIQNGQLHPKTFDLLRIRQIYITGNIGMTLNWQDNGLTVSLSPAAAQAEMQRAALESVRINLARAQGQAVTRTLEEMPPAAATVQAVRRRQEELERSFMELYQIKTPTREDVVQLKEIFEEAKNSVMYETMALRNEAMNSQRMIQEAIQGTASQYQVSPPKHSGEPCETHQWAHNDTYRFVCQEGRWKRYRVDSVW